jgi:orotate phosphoribosyltransferase
MIRRDRLVSLLKERSLQLGSFKLASGRESHYYIDARRTTMSASGLQLIGSLGLEVIRGANWSPSMVGGLTLGADPVSYAIAAASQSAPPVIDAFTVRKEAKSHGTGRRIEGCFREGVQVVVAEDVVTTGGSALNAIRVLEAAGAEVVGVLAVVDRQEGGRAAIEHEGYPLQVLVTLEDLGIEPEDRRI